MDLRQQWIIIWTFLVIGIGFGLLIGGFLADVTKQGRILYSVGTVIILGAGAAYLMEIYLFFIPQ